MFNYNGDHGEHHGDHGNGDHSGGDVQCSMNMYFNWDIENTCIIFSWWRINSIAMLLFSMLIIFGLAVSYEWLRQQTKKYDERILDINSRIVRGTNREDNIQEDILLLGGRGRQSGIRMSYRQHICRSFFYSCLVAYSFFLMLIFMTYNGYLMLSVIAGAGTGFFLFPSDDLGSSRGMQCH